MTDDMLARGCAMGVVDVPSDEDWRQVDDVLKRTGEEMAAAEAEEDAEPAPTEA